MTHPPRSPDAPEFMITLGVYLLATAMTALSFARGGCSCPGS
jgi:hypothetical protein